MQYWLQNSLPHISVFIRKLNESTLNNSGPHEKNLFFFSFTKQIPPNKQYLAKTQAKFWTTRSIATNPKLTSCPHQKFKVPYKVTCLLTDL